MDGKLRLASVRAETEAKNAGDISLSRSSSAATLPKGRTAPSKTGIIKAGLNESNILTGGRRRNGTGVKPGAPAADPKVPKTPAAVKKVEVVCSEWSINLGEVLEIEEELEEMEMPTLKPGAQQKVVPTRDEPKRSEKKADRKGDKEGPPPPRRDPPSKGDGGPPGDDGSDDEDGSHDDDGGDDDDDDREWGNLKRRTTDGDLVALDASEGGAITHAQVLKVLGVDWFLQVRSDVASPEIQESITTIRDMINIVYQKEFFFLRGTAFSISTQDLQEFFAVVHSINPGEAKQIALIYLIVVQERELFAKSKAMANKWGVSSHMWSQDVTHLKVQRLREVWWRRGEHTKALMMFPTLATNIFFTVAGGRVPVDWTTDEAQKYHDILQPLTDANEFFSARLRVGELEVLCSAASRCFGRVGDGSRYYSDELLHGLVTRKLYDEVADVMRAPTQSSDDGAGDDAAGAGDEVVEETDDDEPLAAPKAKVKAPVPDFSNPANFPKHVAFEIDKCANIQHYNLNKDDDLDKVVINLARLVRTLTQNHHLNGVKARDIQSYLRWKIEERFSTLYPNTALPRANDQEAGIKRHAGNAPPTREPAKKKRARETEQAAKEPNVQPIVQAIPIVQPIVQPAVQPAPLPSSAEKGRQSRKTLDPERKRIRQGNVERGLAVENLDPTPFEVPKKNPPETEALAVPAASSTEVKAWPEVRPENPENLEAARRTGMDRNIMTEVVLKMGELEADCPDVQERLIRSMNLVIVDSRNKCEAFFTKRIRDEQLDDLQWNSWVIRVSQIGKTFEDVAVLIYNSVFDQSKSLLGKTGVGRYPSPGMVKYLSERKEDLKSYIHHRLKTAYLTFLVHQIRATSVRTPTKETPPKERNSIGLVERLSNIFMGTPTRPEAADVSSPAAGGKPAEVAAPAPAVAAAPAPAEAAAPAEEVAAPALAVAAAPAQPAKKFWTVWSNDEPGFWSDRYADKMQCRERKWLSNAFWVDDPDWTGRVFEKLQCRNAYTEREMERIIDVISLYGGMPIFRNLTMFIGAADDLGEREMYLKGVRHHKLQGDTVGYLNVTVNKEMIITAATVDSDFVAKSSELPAGFEPYNPEHPYKNMLGYTWKGRRHIPTDPQNFLRKWFAPFINARW